jgi:response regulator RpfG family c-di-GMP phosphodiesterase
MALTEISDTKAEMRNFILEVIRTLVALLDEKDPFIRKHSERVADNCANFCEEYKILGAEDAELIR